MDSFDENIGHPYPLVHLVSSLKERYDVSARALADEIKEIAKNLERDTPASASHLTRALNGQRQIDLNTVGLIGYYTGLRCELPPEVTMAAARAEYWIWHHTIHPPAAPPEAIDLRVPVVRRALFRTVVDQILNKRRRVVSVCAGNEKQVGRSAFALSVAQYCGADAPPEVRRSLFISSLAQLDSNEQSVRPVDVERIAGRISVDIGVPRRSGFGAIQGIADFFRYIPRPLLLIKDGNGVPFDVLADFIAQLIERLPSSSTLTLLVATERALGGEIDECSVALEYLTPQEMAAYIVWKTNCSYSQLPDLETLCGDLKRELRRPSVASILAGGYMLNRLHDSSTHTNVAPWNWFGPQSKDLLEDRNRNVAETIGTLTAEHNFSDEKQVFSIFLSNLTAREKALLFSLAVFNGRFSKEAACACFGVTKESSLHSRLRFERLLDRLCLAGLVIYERSTDPLYLFSLEAEVQEWLRNQQELSQKSNKRVHKYLHSKNASRSKQRYFRYIWNEVRSALDYFRNDPHAIDPATTQAFSRLITETFHIDNFLTDIWSLMESPKRGGKVINQNLALPELDESMSEEFYQDLDKVDRQKIWLALLCANLALFWEVNNLPGSALFHLDKATLMLNGMIDRYAKPSNVTQIRAIRAQIQLSRLLIQIRYRRNQLSLSDYSVLQDIIEEDVEISNYEYGRALLRLISGTLSNWRLCNNDLEEIDMATGEAAALADRYAKEGSDGESLLMMQMRAPLSRYLVFSCQQEKALIQLHSGDIPASLRTGELLLQTAMFVREPRLIARSLLSLSCTFWFSFALEFSHSFGDNQLRQIRDLLFQVDPYITGQPSDKATLRANYLCVLGLYNVEKGLAAQNGLVDKIIHRRAYGEELFSTGLSQVSDVQGRSTYLALLADSYLRYSFVAATDHSIDARSIAFSYFLRSLQQVLDEENAVSSISKSIDKIYSRFRESFSTDEIYGAVTIYCLTSTNNGKSQKLLQRFLEYFAL